jgi:dUTP pyrophosphatase
VQAVELKILDRRLREWGLPRYQTDGAAAIDLMACVDRAVLVRPDTPAELISAGIALHMADPGMAALILPRSGMGHKRGLVLGNLVGLIDADYTGPVMVSAWNRNAPGTPPIRIEPGDRFAQMIFVPVVRPEFSVVEEFTAPSERGAGGFGSTGRR